MGKKYITIDGMDFIDRNGNKVVLNGINVVCKDPKLGYVFELSETDWANLKKYQINIVRLGIHWNILEPFPGMINQNYLDRVEAQVNDFEAHDIPVFLDMHQDLYSEKYDNGAPLWATYGKGPHTMKNQWYHAYYISEDVRTASDAFWDNADGPDGIGLQDHFAAAWKAVAARFADHPNVIGYDLLNEPTPGELSRKLGIAMMQALADWQSEVQGRKVTWEEAYGMYWDMERYHKCLETLDAEKNMELWKYAYPYTSKFDIEYLQPFYEKVSAAIREADQRTLLFLCNTNQTNMGTRSALKAVQVNGKRDPNQVFACHAYDMICDAPNQNAYRQDRINATLEQHLEVAKENNWPVLVGEWGALPHESFTSLKKYRETRKKMAELGISQTYWAYGPSSGRPNFLDEIYDTDK